MSAISEFAPAKLNLFLAITGRREDGFHELVSVVAPLDFGDTLRVEPAAQFSLECNDPDVPCDGSNLVLKAATLFRRAMAADHDRDVAGAKFVLEKRIPLGAGLGGGSSDAVAALRALNRLAGEEKSLPAGRIAEIAAQLGSDCPLFLSGGPIVMRGRGERVDALPEPAVQRLRGRRVLVFKPAFAIATAWAYAHLAAMTPASYLALDEAESRVEAWIRDESAPAEALLFNNMELPAFAKFLALPVLIEQLRGEFGLAPRMSGSGSACFVFLRDEHEPARIAATIRAAWGDSAFVIEARLG